MTENEMAKLPLVFDLWFVGGVVLQTLNYPPLLKRIDVMNIQMLPTAIQLIAIKMFIIFTVFQMHIIIDSIIQFIWAWNCNKKIQSFPWFVKFTNGCDVVHHAYTIHTHFGILYLQKCNFCEFCDNRRCRLFASHLPFVCLMIIERWLLFFLSWIKVTRSAWQTKFVWHTKIYF